MGMMCIHIKRRKHRTSSTSVKQYKESRNQKESKDVTSGKRKMTIGIEMGRFSFAWKRISRVKIIYILVSWSKLVEIKERLMAKLGCDPETPI